jgi:hypothetical protein
VTNKGERRGLILMILIEIGIGSGPAGDL